MLLSSVRENTIKPTGMQWRLFYFIMIRPVLSFDCRIGYSWYKKGLCDIMQY